MRNYYFFVMLFIFAFSLNAQVGIGTMTPSESAEFDVTSSDKGILIPRVPLTSLTSSSPIATTPEESLVVYNTTANTTLVPGFYYWTGAGWSLLASSNNISDLETQTTITYNNGVYTYTAEDKTTTDLNIASNIDEFESVTTLSFDATKNSLVYLDEDGLSHEIDMSAIAKLNETLTTLTLNSDGKTLEYKDEKGLSTKIDLEPVIDQYETVTALDLWPGGTLAYFNEDGGAPKELKLTDEFWGVKGNDLPYTGSIGTTTDFGVLFKTNDQSRGGISKDGRFFWGHSTMINPNSTFNVKGSQSASITSQTGDYTATVQDYVIVFKATSPVNLTLPDPTNLSGRLYVILNYGAAELNISPAINTGYNQSTSVLSNGVGKEGGITFGNRITIQSDGTNWLVIDN